MTKFVQGLHGDRHQHWSGDGFAVRTQFSDEISNQHIRPFLLLDYLNSHGFEPSAVQTGMGQQNRRGIEMVTELEDSSEMPLLIREGESVHMQASGDIAILPFSGQPIEELIAAYTHFVMTMETESRHGSL